MGRTGVIPKRKYEKNGGSSTNKKNQGPFPSSKDPKNFPGAGRAPKDRASQKGFEEAKGGRTSE